MTSPYSHRCILGLKGPKKACLHCSCKLPAPPTNDNKASSASDVSETIGEAERQRKRKELYDDLLREPPFKRMCLKAAELKADSLHHNSDPNMAKVPKDVTMAVEKQAQILEDLVMTVRKEVQKLNQARCGALLIRNTELKLSGDRRIGKKGVLANFKLEEDIGEDNTWLEIGGDLLGFVKKSKSKDDCDKEMKMDVKLYGVKIFPEVDGQGGDTIIGTLEAHSNKFIYKTSTNYFYSELLYDYDNVKDLFFQLEDDKEVMSGKEKILPLLHFRLHHPIKVGTEMREHIQFRLVPTKFEKQKQTKEGGRSKDLKYFIGKVGEKWWGVCPPFSFSQVFKRGEFHGVLPNKKSSDNFIFTFSSILQLQSTSFVVVGMQEIEFVHLTMLRPKEVDMTIVFTDFKRPVLQINSIPSLS